MRELKSIIAYLFIVAGILLVLGLFGCGTQTMERRDYPMRRQLGNPKFGKNDRVHKTNHYILIWTDASIFIIDTGYVSNGQVYYDVHRVNGIREYRLPEGSIGKI